MKSETTEGGSFLGVFELLRHCNDPQISGCPKTYDTPYLFPLGSLIATLRQSSYLQVTANSYLLITRYFCPICGARARMVLAEMWIVAVNGPSLDDRGHFQLNARQMAKKRFSLVAAWRGLHLSDGAVVSLK